jgi:hypothetical protein
MGGGQELDEDRWVIVWTTDDPNYNPNRAVVAAGHLLSY